MCNYQANCHNLIKSLTKNIQTLSYASFFCFIVLLLPACATNNTNQQPKDRADSGTRADVAGLVADNTTEDADNSLTNKSRLSKLDQEMRKEWGVEVVGIRQSAAGYMLDFRYRVLDAEKATPLLDRRIKPELVVAKSGATLKVPVPPKIGALRQSAKFVKEDRNYFILFSNPGRHVIPGDIVSVVIGEFKAENLTVQ